MFQRTTIVGYLGNTPEQRFTPEGKAVTGFSVAVSDRKGDTTWFRVTVWDQQAEACAQYLHKGSPVLVEGRLQHDGNGNPKTFQRKDGTWSASFELTASTVKFLPGKGDTQEQEVAF
jgi:single-strand DNA-binding protein